MKIYWYTKTPPLISEGNIGITSSAESVYINGGTETLDTVNGVQMYKVGVDIVIDDSSYCYRVIMQTPELVLKYSLPIYLEIPIGAWCSYRGTKYILFSPQQFKKHGERNYEYTLTMHTLQMSLSLYKLHNSVDRRLKFSMCAKPHEFIEEIVRNLNERDGEGVWSVGDCIDSAEKTIEFNHTYIMDALNSVASTFETEFEISSNHCISLHKVESYKDDPLPLSYGMGNGFVPGVGRATQSDQAPVKRLYTQGTDRNIDRSKNLPSLYGATPQDTDYTTAELRLPSSQKILFDGEKYGYMVGDSVVGDEGFNERSARTYQTDRDGFYVERIEPKSDAVKEDSLDCTEIYPSYYGTVDVVTDGTEHNAQEKHFIDFTDPNAPVNFNDYIMADNDMTIIFQSGMLSGKEFKVKYRGADKRWELVPQEIDGIIMPDRASGYIPRHGDTYAVFGIMLPTEYICDNGNHSGASWDMLREAVKYLYEHENQAFTFTGELQGLWAKRHWLEYGLGDRLKPGSYIHFSDKHFCPDGEDIRIVGIKDYVNTPHSPTIEISNSVVSATSVSSQLKDIDTIEVVIEDAHKRAISYSKRRFRDAVETIDMLKDSMLEGFTDFINPIAIQTMSLLVGDESLQFYFFDEDGNRDETVIRLDNGELSCAATFLRHMTLDVDTITSPQGRENTNYNVWQMQSKNFGYLDPETYGKMYLYASCSKLASVAPYRRGQFVLSQTPMSFETANSYNFLVGIVNSEFEGERSFVSLYGFTEILPGRVTTDKLVSADGYSWINLAAGSMQLGSTDGICLQYNIDGDKTLHLKFLTSENSNLGGWIFRDGMLISQRGTVGGQNAEYTEGDAFIPNISLDGINGVIKQADNLMLDENGLTLLNSTGGVAAQITNKSIGNPQDTADASVTVSESFNCNDWPVYLPYPSASADSPSIYTSSRAIANIPLNSLTEGMTINVSNLNVTFTVPKRYAGNAAQLPSDNLHVTEAKVAVYLYRGNTRVAQLAYGSTSGDYQSGQQITISRNSGNPSQINTEGNYTLRIQLTLSLWSLQSGTYQNVVIDGNGNSVTFIKANKLYRRTILGNDGFFTSWASNQYLLANSTGIKMRHGAYVLLISPAGIQVSSDGGVQYHVIDPNRTATVS